MPNITNNDTVQAIAQAYCTNGNNKEQALITAGYSLTYAGNGNGHKLWGNVRLTDAIAAIMAPAAEECKLTAESVITRLQQLSGLAPLKAGETVLPVTTDAGQIRSLDLLGKHLKLWDRAGESDPNDTPNSYTQQDLDDARRDAMALTLSTLARPKHVDNRVLEQGESHEV